MSQDTDPVIAKPISQLPEYTGSPDQFTIPGIDQGTTKKANLGTLITKAITADTTKASASQLSALTQQVSSKANQSEVTQLSLKVGDLGVTYKNEEFDNLNPQRGRIMASTGEINAGTSSSPYRYVEFPISKGMSIYAKSRVGTTSSVIAALYDGDGVMYDKAEPSNVQIGWNAVAQYDGKVVFSWNNTYTSSIILTLSASGMVAKLDDVSTKTSELYDIPMMLTLCQGRKLVKYAKEHQFTWSFPKPIFSIHVADLENSVDIACKIAEEEGFPICLNAVVEHIGWSVSGAYGEDSAIATRMDICHRVVDNGGEVLMHSTETYTNKSQIKKLFYDFKRVFFENGIEVRGAALANSAPSTNALYEALEPYLRALYDYSTGYGNTAPYFGSSTDMSHTYIVGDNVSVESIESTIATLARQNYWHRVTFHDVGSGTNHPNSQETFRAALQKIKQLADAGSVLIMTGSNVYDTYGTYN